MKKFFAMLFLTFTFAAAVNAAPPCMPKPCCFPCAPGSN